MDLPRVAILGVLLLLATKSILTGRFALRGARRTLTLLVGLAVWQVLSAITADARGGALTWAVGNILTMWGFAIAVTSLTGGADQRARVARVLVLLATILALWSIGELVTQHKLFPTRNLFIESGQRFSTTLRRLIPGSRGIILPYMSIGPFASSLSFAGVLCALGGFLLVATEKARRSTIRLRVAMFVAAVMATQSRVGVLAAAAMLAGTTLWGRSRERRWTLPVAATMVATILMLGGSQLRLAFQTAYSGVVAGEESRGSLGRRLRNLEAMRDDFGEWWLLGFGPGSLFDADRVASSVQLFTDPGSLFAFFLESGMPAGLMLTVLVVTSIRTGSRSQIAEARAAAIGLLGFSITTLSSITPWGSRASR